MDWQKVNRCTHLFIDLNGCYVKIQNYNGYVKWPISSVTPFISVLFKVEITTIEESIEIS